MLTVFQFDILKCDIQKLGHSLKSVPFQLKKINKFDLFFFFYIHEMKTSSLCFDIFVIPVTEALNYEFT